MRSGRYKFHISGIRGCGQGFFGYTDDISGFIAFVYEQHGLFFCGEFPPERQQSGYLCVRYKEELWEKETIDEVAGNLKNLIENDIPGFETKIKQILWMYESQDDVLKVDMAKAIDLALKADTKLRFMNDISPEYYACVIKRAMLNGPYQSYDLFDKAMNEILNQETP